MVLPHIRYTQCSGDDSSPCNVTDTTRVDKRNHLLTFHSDRNEMEWRNLPKLQILPYAGYYCNLGGYLHSADAAVGMTTGVTFLPIRLLFLQHFTPPRGPHQARPGEPASPEGSFCTVSAGSALYMTEIYSQRPRNGTQAVPYIL